MGSFALPGGLFSGTLMVAIDRVLRDAFEAAIFEAMLPGGTVWFSLSGPPMGAVARVANRRLAIVTAYNPGQGRPGEAVNRAANERLRCYLVEQQYEFDPAVGYSPDRSHEEPSLAVLDLGTGEAQALGARFQQACVFYWNGQRGSLVWCS